MTGGVWRGAAIPDAATFDLRSALQQRPQLSTAATDQTEYDEAFAAGSNSWAVGATHTQDGRALLANDMHLGLRLPHIWYRMRLVVDGDIEPRRDLIGVTLPGLPLLIAGSNGRVAWGYTNSFGDWTDRVLVEVDSQDPLRYRVGEHSEPFVIHRETIVVREAEPVELVVRGTRWGPIVDIDGERLIALAWTAHRPEASNLGMLEFERAADVGELLDFANRAGGPVQNVVAADAQGSIGWSLMGRVPRRAGYDSTVPALWNETVGWTGWREPEEYPRLVDPPSGRLWTANARVLDAVTWLEFMGEAGYDLGARGAQIRDALFGLSAATADDMVALQLDDRALFLSRWRDLMLEVLNHAPAAAARTQARELVSAWSGRAGVDDAGYTLVRTFRQRVLNGVFAPIAVLASQHASHAHYRSSNQFEEPLWALIMEQPLHWLSPQFASWRDALLHWLDEALLELQSTCGRLERCEWGRLNALRMRHPLSAIPGAGYWLDMPAQPLPGDSHMPRVQGREFGASQRLVVSPGHEADGRFEMPGGPSGHPLSPFYDAGHDAWVEGISAPLLPGPAAYTLVLSPDEAFNLSR